MLVVSRGWLAVRLGALGEEIERDREKEYTDRKERRV